MALFCPNCAAYFPAGRLCPTCGHKRLAWDIPAPPQQPFWRARVPGGVAANLTLARLGGRPVLVVPWGHLPQRGDSRPLNGGVSLLELSNGSLIWEQSLGIPIEGGAVAVEDAIVVGMGTRGIGAGQGALAALDLRKGSVLWHRQIEGAILGAPITDGVRIYAAGCDGAVYCLDAREGKLVWRSPICEGPTSISASPILIKERATTLAIVVATYGSPHWQKEGRVVALDEQGRRLWEQSAGGNVRGTPVLAGGKLFVAAFRSSPSVGLLNAFDARTGRPIWPQPFTIQGQPADRVSYNFSASPLVYGCRVYVGSLNHRLYALEAATGKLLWEREVGAGIATAPAPIEGLIVFGANNGCVYALDAESGEKAWDYALSDPLPAECSATKKPATVLTGPLPFGNMIVVASDEGVVAMLPWHLGQYEWAGERLERASRLVEAGDCHALAGHFSVQPDVRERCYQRAADEWMRAGEPERAAQMWLALDRRDWAADTYRAAGERWRTQDCLRAAGYFRRAAELYFTLRRREELNACTRAIATCVRLPHVLLQVVNIGGFIQWEPGELTLRITNDGFDTLPSGIKLWLGGALKSALVVEILSPLGVGQSWNIPMTVMPTRREGTLDIEVEYDPGVPEYAPLHSMLAIPIEAAEKPQPLIDVGDVGVLKLEVASFTKEGLMIVTRDVGMMRSDGGIASVKAEGDIGAILSRGR